MSINLDLRVIVHRSSASVLLCYVDHHDKAYAWAHHRKVETHPKTGAAQLVEVRESIREIVVPQYTQAEEKKTPKSPLFSGIPNEELLGHGVPLEWIADVQAADEDSLLALAEHLPSEAAEALLDLATGKKLQRVSTALASKDPFAHPDAQRRFRVMHNVEELERALEYPWEKWSVFLHPEQQQLVERDYSGPARVSGSAGAGKTIVALHRAVFLAKSNPDSRVLLATFSEALANALRKLKVLLHHSPRIGERLEVYLMDEIGRRLYKLNVGNFKTAAEEDVKAIIATCASEAHENKFTHQFLFNEWETIVDAWQLTTWEQYRDVTRLGRKTRLPEKQRAALWSVFERVRESLAAKKLITSSEMFTGLSVKMSLSKNPPFDFAVIDEAQDITVSQLRFLAALGANRGTSLFFAGDLGQRIFQQPFSWKELGVDIRGRAKTLRINYRTSHQIRNHADRLLDPEMRDVDGNVESRKGTISVFNGPSPEIRVLDSQDAEIQEVGAWLKERIAEGLRSHEIGVFVRSAAELVRARSAVARANLASRDLDVVVETEFDHVAVGTMHLAKGLEFRAVAIMACDDEVIPSQARIESVTDDADLEEVYNTERQLLYVACTRARDRLLVTGVNPGSEFVEDLRG